MITRRAALVATAALLLAGLAAWWWAWEHPPETSRTQFVLDTLVTITAGGTGSDEAVEKAFAEMSRVERRLSSYSPGSDLARVNAAAGIGPVKVSPEGYRFLKDLQAYSRRTQGAFDPTVGPLVALWGFTDERPAVPPAGKIAALLPLVSAESLELDPRGGTVYLSLRGMSLDVGGALKGYAVDRAAEILRAAKVRYALIDAGRSSLMVIGRRPGGRPWLIGIGDPRREGEVVGTVRLDDGDALGTSADNTRFFIAEGVRYSHLLDPATGWPARYNRLVTVRSRSAFAADVFSKAFVKPTSEVLPLLRRLGVDGLAIAADGRLLADLAGFEASTTERKR